MIVEPSLPTETALAVSRRCSQLTAQGTACQAWAIRGSEPPLCSAHAGRNVGAGAPLGNQNRTTHGFYSRSFRLDELQDLLEEETNLALEGEIACARVALRRVMAMLADPDRELPSGEYTRLASLAFYGARTVARLMRDQNVLAPGYSDSLDRALNAALDELSEEWGIEL